MKTKVRVELVLALSTMAAFCGVVYYYSTQGNPPPPTNQIVPGTNTHVWPLPPTNHTRRLVLNPNLPTNFPYGSHVAIFDRMAYPGWSTQHLTSAQLAQTGDWHPSTNGLITVYSHTSPDGTKVNFIVEPSTTFLTNAQTGALTPVLH